MCETTQYVEWTMKSKGTTAGGTAGTNTKTPTNIGLAGAFKDKGTLLPGPRLFEYEGKRFLLMHEDGCVDQLQTAQNIDVVVYGHTHAPDIRPGKPLIINPGECGGWLSGRRTVAIWDLEKQQVNTVVI